MIDLIRRVVILKFEVSNKLNEEYGKLWSLWEFFIEIECSFVDMAVVGDFCSLFFTPSGDKRGSLACIFFSSPLTWLRPRSRKILFTHISLPCRFLFFFSYALPPSLHWRFFSCLSQEPEQFVNSHYHASFQLAGYETLGQIYVCVFMSVCGLGCRYFRAGAFLRWKHAGECTVREWTSQ